MESFEFSRSLNKEKAKKKKGRGELNNILQVPLPRQAQTNLRNTNPTSIYKGAQILPETEASQYFNSVPTIMLNRYTVLLK
jgi:hypothetical protein